MRFNRYHLIVINVFLKVRTIPKTVEEIGRLSGKPLKTDSFVRKIVKSYQQSAHR